MLLLDPGEVVIQAAGGPSTTTPTGAGPYFDDAAGASSILLTADLQTQLGNAV